jgi:hypothetical protein
LWVAFHDGVEDAEFVGSEGGAGFGDVNDGIDKVGDFGFCGSPGEFDVGGDAVLFKVFFYEFDGFGGDAFSLKVFDGLVWGVFGYGEDPACGEGSGFVVLEVADDVDRSAFFSDPVFACDGAIKKALRDVAGDFLGADEAGGESGVVDVGAVASGGIGELVACAGEELYGGIFKAAFGEADSDW